LRHELTAADAAGGGGRASHHDYKRNGTTTLFAALNVLDGKVIGRSMARHRHQELIRFLNAVEREVSSIGRARGSGRQGDPRHP
jgi:hypothetical protein